MSEKETHIETPSPYQRGRVGGEGLRYNRQIILPEIGAEGQQKLSAAKVLIVGVGGLGSPIALYLAGAGVGVLGLIDDDVVSVSNLQRQVLYEEKQVGQPKVFCAQRRLTSLNSEIMVNAYYDRLTKDNAMEIISHYDIVVDGTDNFDVRYVISDACAAQHKPYVYGAITGLEGQVAVLCVPKGSDMNPNKEGTTITYRDLYPYSDEEAGNLSPLPSEAEREGRGGSPVVGVTPGIVGTVEASQVLQLICGYGEPLIDKLWTIDLRTLQSFIIEL